MTPVHPEVRGWRPGPVPVRWLVLATVAVVAPHLGHVPAWLAAESLAIVAWAAGASSGRLRPPAQVVLLALSLAAPLGVFASYGTVFGRDAGVAMLVILSACKLAETRTARDAYVLVLLDCFLAITGFLFSQSILAGTYGLAVVVVVAAALLALNDRGGTLRWLRTVRTAAALVTQALPLAVALFVLFPRLPGPLWGLPHDARAGVARLADHMSPGRISDLTLSDAVAFRVQFTGSPPAPRELYWRGPVLWRTDGWEWSGIDTETRRVAPLRVEGAPTDYTVTLEPHFEHWLFALDVPVRAPIGATMTGDYQLRSPRRVSTLRRYRVRSYTHYLMPMLDPRERQWGLELPSGFHPRARALARGWREEIARNLGRAPPGTLERALVARALRYFRERPFHYTLHPPLLDRDPVDEFLFQTRRGFCEFYASAFTVLMRAAGVPARVVTGYQGGEFNPVGGYLIVRQRDAHAWTEVWIPNRGWVRVDPTAAVSPARIERGVDAALPEGVPSAVLGLIPSGRAARALRAFRHSLDALDNAWDQWVIDYGEARQRRLLAHLGIDAGDWRALAVALVAAGALALGAAAWWLRRPAPVRDRALRAYLRFCVKLRRRGLARAPHEGPNTFAERVVRARPDLAGKVRAITGLYVDLRYGGQPAPPALATLEAEVGRFRP